MRIGAIDIGSNSTRLLVAELVDGRLRELDRDSTVTRLADGVDGNGALSGAAIDRVHAALLGYAERIERAGCDRAGGIATSAVRDAANGADFVRQMSDAIGIGIEVIPGDREAQLTFAGASSGDALDPTAQSLVVDIGGGSTEFIIGQNGELKFQVSTQLGAVRQSERHLSSDPPTAAELAALGKEISEVIAANVPGELRSTTTNAIAVAGTPTVLASVDQRLAVFDPWKVHGYAITAEACARMLAELAALPLAERRAVTGLHPDRAPTIVAGAAILSATLGAFGLDAATVSEHDILYGLGLQLAAG